MKASTTLPKYTAQQVKEITDRIVALRTRWLSVVEAQLASHQSRAIPARSGIVLK
jgi:hypothetical protein